MFVKKNPKHFALFPRFVKLNCVPPAVWICKYISSYINPPPSIESNNSRFKMNFY